MTTPILGITEVANNQTNQYLTVNEAVRALEAATNDVLEVDLEDGNITLTDEQFASAVLFKIVGNSVARNLTVPAKKRLFTVFNGGEADINVVRGTTSILVVTSTALMMYADGTTNGLYLIAGGGGGGASSVAVTATSVSGVLDLSEISAETVAVTLHEDITSIALPEGTDGRRAEILLRFVQDATGGWEVDLSDFAWSGDGVPPDVEGAPYAVTYVAAVNVDESGWEAFK